MIQWEDYLRNVGKRFIGLLEERSITGQGMPLRDFVGTIKYIKLIGQNVTHAI